MAAAWAAGATGTAPTSGSARTAAPAHSALGRHGRIVIDLRGGNHQKTFLALARKDNFAVLSSFEQSIEAVEAQIALWTVLAVAPQTRSFKERANIFGIGECLFIRRRGQFGEVELADVPFVVGLGRTCRQSHAK